MNETIRNTIVNSTLDQTRPTGLSASFTSGLRGASRLTRRGGILLALLGATLSLQACGDDSPEPNSSTEAANGSKPTAESLHGLSKTDCHSSPLVNQWRVYDKGKDVITIDEDCIVEGYACGSIGYINSEVTTEVGIAEVVIVYSQNLPGCAGAGTYQCAYDARNASFQELHFDCH
jgi:hypothetical protein